ncbi:MAG: 5-guanidino-2-oxopentanoate decarboxylase [Actinomycetota bacterium]|nr:5-guanidino-2-oxopentanoate decarboxylase [Actinomycetota bacterium]
MREDLAVPAASGGSRRSATCGALAVQSLALHGVDTVFGIPGTHNLDLYAHLSGAGIRHVLPRHEQGAGYAATGWARTSGRPGVVFVTTGPGVMNLATAAAQAWSDSVPLLILAPGMPRCHPAGGSGYLHEMPSQPRAMEGVVGRAVRVGSGEELAQELAAAFTSFASQRPRPAYVEIPLDLLAEEAHAEPLAAPIVSAPAPHRELFERAASVLSVAGTVAVIVGGGAAGAGEEVIALVERLGAPVLSTANGKGVVPEDHPLSLGGRLNLPAARELIESAEVVVAIGTELAQSDLWDGPLWIGGQVIRIDIDPDQAHRGAAATIALISDAASCLRTLSAALGAPDRSDGNRESVARVRQALTRDVERQGSRWLEPLAAIRDAAPRATIFTADSAMSCYYGALPALPVYAPNGFIYPSGFGTLGFSVPAAIGAKLAAPGREVVALSGDGGLMFTVAELASAAALGLSLPVVVFTNRGYGEIRNEMVARGDAAIGVDLPAPDLPALAQALGCAGVTATDTDGLAGELADAFERSAPTLIEVPEPDG